MENRYRISQFEALGPVLVTGHTGFKGTWLTLLLEKLGLEVSGYSLPPLHDSMYSRLSLSGRIPEQFGDIRDTESFSNFIKIHQPRTVIHLAAQALVLKSYEAPIETFDVNVMGTAKVISESMESTSIRNVGVATTDKVYDNQETGRAFVETDPLFGKDPYSASKVGTEAVVAAWQLITNKQNAVKICSLRAGNVIGGGDFAENRLFPDLIRSHINQSELIVRNPESTRPWQHVLDPLFGYLLAISNMQQTNNQLSFNFGPRDSSLNVRKALEIAKENWPFELSFNFISNQGAKLEAKDLHLNSDRANSVLNWEPKWNQSEAIAKTMDWWSSVLITGVDPLIATLKDIDEFLSR